MQTKIAPDGYTTVSPYLLVDDVDGLIEFIRLVFDGIVVQRQIRPDGSPGHAEVRVGDSLIMMGGSSSVPAHLHVYVADVDATYALALSLGAVVVQEPAMQAHGDRMAGVQDRFGNTWWIASPAHEKRQ